MLIDGRAGSQSEHSGLLYRAANGTVFVGSPTEGVDGDETFMVAPGGIWITFSGSDVRWPDGKQSAARRAGPRLRHAPELTHLHFPKMTQAGGSGGHRQEWWRPRDSNGRFSYLVDS